MVKKNLTKVAALGMVSAMAVTSMFGCSKDDNKDTTTQAGNTSSTQAPSGKKTTIEVMAFTEEVPNMFKKYVSTHPDFAAKYELNYTVVATDDGAYQKALDQVLADGGAKTPNIYMAEAAFVKKYTTGSASSYACTYEDLGIDVEKKIKDAGIAQYSADITRRDGKVVALGYQANGGAFIYNREVAKDVFGDDKPETVEAAIGKDWDSFFEAAEKCKAKGYAIVSGDGDIWHAIENSSDKGWVVDGKLYIDPKREAFLDYSKKLKDNGYHNDTKDWTEGWYADMEEIGPKKVLGFYGPAWLINYTFKDHCGYKLSEDGKTVESMGTYGQWGVCKPNVGFFWGGTWLVANKNVLNNADIKAGVKELIEYVTLDTSDTGLQYEWANAKFSDSVKTKDVVASSVVMERSNGTLEFLNGQDAFPTFIAGCAYAKGDNLTEYDEAINTQWRDAVRAYTSGEKTREEAIKWFKQQIKDNMPSITVE
ncbi:MAG: carbohydrate ABC transporter substrate-binding protein [Lachnospiraceae bacterium]|nr:carbohydrate ABC transporter substrate-binding protein [Lachnospiraceae bacterium]